MRSKRSGYIKNLLAPCFVFSAVAGTVTGALVFLFKILSSAVIGASTAVYGYFRENIALIPVLLVGAALIGFFSWLILRWASECRGGGIPTAVAALRGLIPFKWLKSAFIMPLSALLTFFCGVPLGNEGPCVQMGTAIGKGTVQILGRKKIAWKRYIMTGGACAGFASATGAPITGILFAIEEAHRRFSPLLFMVASISVVASQVTMELLCALSGTDSRMFPELIIAEELPLKFLWAALTVGLAAGICAIFFTKAYVKISKLVSEKLSALPLILKIIAVFLMTAVLGTISSDFIGSGHSLMESLIEGHGVWYFIIICFFVRAALLMFANNTGVTGGLFVPTLAFGAMIGALCGKAMLALGIIEARFYPLLVVIGMVSFLAASSRTPIAALVFAVEALCGLSNILPVGIGVTIAFLVIETAGVECFNDTVIETKVDKQNAGKTAQIFDMRLTVSADTFVVGKEIRDILWPSTCVVLSVDKNQDAPLQSGIGVGDVLHVHYRSYYPDHTYGELEALVGAQDGKITANVHMAGENHQVPEL